MSIRKRTLKLEIWIPVIGALIAAIGSVIVAVINIQKAEINVRQELQPTISALETGVAKLTATPLTQLITPTGTVQVMPTPDENILLLDSSIPSQVFPFSGGNDPQIQSQGRMLITYEESGTINYKLDYSLPEQGYTWAGIAIQFSPMNLAKYEYIQLELKSSNIKACCELKLADKSDNNVYFLLGDSPRLNSGVVITVDEDRLVIKIPLRGNFDGVNLEQIREVSFISNSNLATGNHNFTVSRIKFLKK